jgi:hypothetical protein
MCAPSRGHRRLDSSTVIEPDESRPRPWLRWLVLFSLSGGSVAIGAALAVSVLLLAGWRHVPVNRYTVSVILETQATVAQREEVRAVLAKLPTVGGVTLQTREQAYADLTKTLTGINKPVPGEFTAETMPETLRASTVGRDFDCSAVTALHVYPGVSHLLVGMEQGGTGQRSTLGC